MKNRKWSHLPIGTIVLIRCPLPGVQWREGTRETIITEHIDTASPLRTMGHIYGGHLGSFADRHIVNVIGHQELSPADLEVI